MRQLQLIRGGTLAPHLPGDTFAGQHPTPFYYDLSTNTVAASLTWDFNFTPSVTLTYDYDMAMRVKMIGSDLLVTGSLNMVHAPPPGGDRFVGGTLCMLLNPSTLAQTYQTGFCLPAAIHDTDAEHGFDVVPNPGNSGDFLVYSNNYAAVSGTEGYDPLPRQFGITALDNTLTPYSISNISVFDRLQFNSFDHAWGVNTVESSTSTAVILSGLEDSRHCNGTDPTTPNNINPFLAEYDFTGTIPTSGIVYSLNFWNTMTSAQGTGTAFLSNSFHNLGGGLSNVVWGPKTTIASLLNSYDIVLTAPVWNTANNRLNMKYIRADYLGAQYNCPYDNCPSTPAGTPVKVDLNGIGTAHIPAYVAQDYGVAVSDITLNQDDFIPDASPDCNNNGFYRPTQVAHTQQPVKVTASVYPNPAGEWIEVKLSGAANGETPVQISLSDVTGRTIATLYNSRAAGLSHNRLQLPAVAAGLYFVCIYSDGSLVKTQRLAIK